MTKKKTVDSTPVEAKSFLLGSRKASSDTWYADDIGFEGALMFAHELGASGRVIVKVELEERKNDGAYVVVKYR